ncbi:MAG: YfiR family protein [Comamonadaceae bacterium]|nr:YfiR family protein [Comamonadaceae bacterium]
MRGLLALLCLLAGMVPAWPGSDELQLKAIFLGRFASYVQWPQAERPSFDITVLGSHPLGAQLAQLYADKRIQGRPVRIHTTSQLHDVGQPDLLFVALPSVVARKDAIVYAQEHGVLTVSDARGFAEQGGVIQINFVEQNAQIKINYDAAVKTGLHIGAPLLSIATVLRRSQP